VLIFVVLKDSYVIMLKIILDKLATWILDIQAVDKMKPKTGVCKIGETKFVPVEWILMLQMMLQQMLLDLLDVLL